MTKNWKPSSVLKAYARVKQRNMTAGEELVLNFLLDPENFDGHAAVKALGNVAEEAKKMRIAELEAELGKLRGK